MRTLFRLARSRNKQIGLEKSRLMGAQITSVETALFELMRTAGHQKFKEIQKIVK